MQPSTVLSVVARRQRAAESQRIAAHKSAGGGACTSISSSNAAQAIPRAVCPLASSPNQPSASGGIFPDGRPAAKTAGERGLERGFICGHQMVAEASMAGWEGVCSGNGAGADGDAAATGVVVSFCGHGMHMECLQRFLETQRNSYGDHAAVLSEREFVCPLCRSLGNTLVPVSALNTPPTAGVHAPPSGPPTSMINLAAFGAADRGGAEAGWDGAKGIVAMDTDEENGLVEQELLGMSVKMLKQFAAGRSPAVDLRSCLEKQDMVQAILASQSQQQTQQSPAAVHERMSGGGSPASGSGGKIAAGGTSSNVRAAPEWWASEPSKLEGFGAESEWVKALPQRGMGVAMATRLHDLMKAATSHQTCARADLGIKDSGTDLMTSAGTAICSAASALVYSVAALELAWRLGGTGAATPEEAAAEAKAQRELEEVEEADLAMEDEDDFLDEGGVLSSAAGATIGGVGLVGRGAGGEGVTTVATNDLIPLMVLARSVRGLMHYPGNESWRWRAVKLWCRLLSGDAVDDSKKTDIGADQRKKRALAIESLLQADHASLLGHWVILAAPLPTSTPGAPAATAASSFSGSICGAEREFLSLEFVDALELLWLAHMAQLLLRATKTVAAAGPAWISEQGYNPDALKRGDGVAVRDMFGQVWAHLPDSAKPGDRLEDSVVEVCANTYAHAHTQDQLNEYLSQLVQLTIEQSPRLLFLVHSGGVLSCNMTKQCGDSQRPLCL